MKSYKASSINHNKLDISKNHIYYKNKLIGEIFIKNDSFIVVNNKHEQVYSSNSLLILKQDLQEMNIKNIFNIC